MGTWNGQIYVPDVDETGWGDEVNETLNRIADMDFTVDDAPDPYDDAIIYLKDSAGAIRRTTIGDLFNSSKTWGFEDDFLVAGDGMTGVIAASNGTGAGVAVDAAQAEVNHPGVMRGTTGTDATGRCGVWSVGILLGGGRARFTAINRLNALSDGTNTYVFRTGFGDAITAEFTDGVFFRYTHSVNGGEWQGVCRSNNTETTLDTNVAGSAGAWVRHGIEVNALGTSVEFFINGTSVGTVTTNIPTGAGRQTGVVAFGVIKSLGAASLTFDCDYVGAGGVLTTAR